MTRLLVLGNGQISEIGTSSARNEIRRRIAGRDIVDAGCGIEAAVQAVWAGIAPGHSSRLRFPIAITVHLDQDSSLKHVATESDGPGTAGTANFRPLHRDGRRIGKT